MRILLARTDAIGDLMVSLPVMERILSRNPTAEVHWLVRPYVAPLLEGMAGVSGIHLRNPDQDLAAMLAPLAFDAVLNLSHRDWEVTVAAKQAGVPLRVARPRRMAQLLAATHSIWSSRAGSGRHEAMHALDFLRPFGWHGGAPALPELHLTPEERARGREELAGFPGPRLGIVLRGSGSGAFPSSDWWAKAMEAFHSAGWNPIILSPEDGSALPATGLRGLLGRLAACDVVLSPSTGPAHLAAALGVPLAVLMGLRKSHGPDRWAPLGRAVQVIRYPGPEADLRGGMDRLEPSALLPHLERLRMP